MTKRKIQAIANFLYSADNSDEVPFRISLTFGMSGMDLDKEDLIKLLETLETKPANKESYLKLLKELGDGADE